MPEVSIPGADQKDRGLWERDSLRSWRDFAGECFFLAASCFGLGHQAARGLVRSRVEIPPAGMRGFFGIMRSPVHANFGLA